MTRNPFARTLVVIFFLLTNFLPVAQPTAARAAPPTPVKAEPSSVPPVPAVTAQSTPLSPRPEALPLAAQEARVRQAAEAALQKSVDRYGPRYGVSIAEVVIEGAWAYAVTQPQAPDGQPLYLLAHMEGGAWQVVMPKEVERYEQWLTDAPSSLLNSAKKEELRAATTQTVASGQNLELADDSRPEVEILRAATTADPTPTPTPQFGRGNAWMPQSSESDTLKLLATPFFIPTVLQENAKIDTGEDWMKGQAGQFPRYAGGVLPEAIVWEREQAAKSLPKYYATYSYPPTKDWRNVNGVDWTTPIKNQNLCGSCVGFGTIAAIESRIKIASGNANINPDLSEAHLYFCSGGRSCLPPNWGWDPEAAMNAARDTGIVDESCYPYVGQEQSCSVCSDWRNQVTKISDWRGVNSTAEMKQALADDGPIEATMATYEDFYDFWWNHGLGL